eukprot:6869305-Ditylum_brightwellii.AAC.1
MSQTAIAAKTTTTATSATAYFDGPSSIFFTNTTISNCSSRGFARSRGPIAKNTKTTADTILPPLTPQPQQPQQPQHQLNPIF